jgi:ribosome-binding protein aMBF1 (putative translation factor)
MGDDAYSHQDWKPVVLRNTSLAKKKELQRGGESTKKTQPSGGPVSGQKNIDADDFVVKKFDKAFGKMVSSKRNQKEMNQDALAKKLCVQKSIIQSVENGTAVYNPSLMSKLRKELEI